MRHEFLYNNELLAIELILDEVGVTKVKHPNKGQKPMYQGVRYSESPLYTYCDPVPNRQNLKPNLNPLIFLQ